MKKLSVLLLTAALSVGLAGQSVAADKPVKQVTCKEEAKNAGLKDKAEIKKFVKQCKKDRKAAKAK